MPLKHKNSDEANKHTPKGFDNASNFSRLLRDEIGQSRYTKEFVFPKAIDFVDGSAPPPTSDLNDVYVIVDMGGGSVHASWGSMSYNDWGRQNGTTWGAVTPTAGDICYDSNAGIYKVFGASWGQLIPDAPNIYDVDGTIGSGREATITDTLTFLGGNLIKKGSDTLGTTSGFKLIDSASADLWDFRINGDVYLSKNTTIFASAKDVKIDTSGGYTGTPFMVESYPFGGAGTKPYLKVKAYGEVQILGRLTDLFTVLDGSGNAVLDVNSGEVKINGVTAITSSFFQVKTTSSAMDFYTSNGGSLAHSITTNIGISDRVRFNILGGTRKFIIGGSSVIGSENISLQGDTLVGITGSKVGFMGATPIVKVTTGVSAGAFVANTSGISDDTATFGGYTIGQIAQALINYGLLT